MNKFEWYGRIVHKAPENPIVHGSFALVPFAVSIDWFHISTEQPGVKNGILIADQENFILLRLIRGAPVLDDL